LQKEGAKKKFTKRNADKGISPSADSEEGYAPSTAPPFEKGGRKLPPNMPVRVPLTVGSLLRFFFKSSYIDHTLDTKR